MTTPERREQILGWMWFYAEHLADPLWRLHFPARSVLYRQRLEYYISQHFPQITIGRLS